MRLRLMLAILALSLIAAVCSWWFTERRLEKIEIISTTSWTPAPGVRYWKPPFEILFKSQEYTGEDLRTNPQIKRLTAAANQLLRGVAGVSAELLLPSPKPESFVPTRAYTLGPQRIELDGKLNPFTFSFCKTNDEFWFYFNIDALQVAEKSGPANRHWTSQQAIEAGTKFLPLFADTSAITLGSPTAVPTSTANEKTNDWEISWQRVDGRGRVIGPDRAILDISETGGLISANVELNDPYAAEPGEPKISESEAVAIAVANARGDAVAVDGPNGKTKKLELLIVAPEGMRGVPARLAWIVWLKHPRSGMSLSSDWMNSEIDAYTGEVLGGESF